MEILLFHPIFFKHFLKNRQLQKGSRIFQILLILLELSSDILLLLES